MDLPDRDQDIQNVDLDKQDSLEVGHSLVDRILEVLNADQPLEQTYRVVVVLAY